LIVYDGVTRATRVAKLLPGQMVTVEVIIRRYNEPGPPLQYALSFRLERGIAVECRADDSALLAIRTVMR